MSSPYSFATRLFLIFVGVFLLIYFGRIFSLPESWGKYGYYRSDYIEEEASLPLVHGNDESCRSCHAEDYEMKYSGAHKQLSCEICHAPVSEHASGKTKIADMPYITGVDQNDLCLKCHQKVIGRPEKFPMVDAAKHFEEQEVDVSNECGVCHTVHEPLETMKYVKRLRTLREGLDDEDDE